MILLEELLRHLKSKYDKLFYFAENYINIDLDGNGIACIFTDTSRACNDKTCKLCFLIDFNDPELIMKIEKFIESL